MKQAIKFLASDLGRIVFGAALFIAALILDLTVGGTLAIVFFVIALLATGYSVFYDAVKGIIRRDFLDEKFLMSIASVGAMLIGDYIEGVAVMLFFLVGEYFEHKAVNKSRKTIKELMDICPDYATILEDGEEVRVFSDEVELGDTLIIKDGERVSVDCEVIFGQCDVDTSALTGESLPRAVCIGDRLISGSVIIGGVVTVRATATAEQSGAARILALVEDATERKSKEENFISAFSRVYTPIVVGLAVLMAVLPPLLSLAELNDAIYRALSFLVVSCPCALVISVPMAFFAGIGTSASRGILFKGSSSFSPISRVSIAAFDKTGTLTRGELSVTYIIPKDGISEDELLNIAASAEYASSHPIALAIKKRANKIYKADDSRVIAGMGISCKISGDEILVGNSLMLTTHEIDFTEEASDGSIVYVARNNDYIGRIILSDTVKEDAKEAIFDLRSLGVEKTVMLSGDKKEVAMAVGETVGIDEVYAELLPDEKFHRLESLIDRKRGGVMYVGDGINDAPSLARADVGVAMGAIGTDSAKESADLVITSDNLKRIPEAVKIARKTLGIAKQNIIFAIGVKVAVLLLSAFGIGSMWLAVFADVGVLVLAVLNSMRMLLGGKAK